MASPPYTISRFLPAGRRTPSFSSSSTSSSWDSSLGSFNEEYPPSSPIASTAPSLNGVPFSWEKIPGIPKHQVSEVKEYSSKNLLPPPPAGDSHSSGKKCSNKERKHHSSNRFKRDPFYAALVECSKDDVDRDHDDANFAHIGRGSRSKISRTLSDGFGSINMYTSCKRTCSISDSLVYLPKSSARYTRLNPRSN